MSDITYIRFAKDGTPLGIYPSSLHKKPPVDAIFVTPEDLEKYRYGLHVRDMKTGECILRPVSLDEKKADKIAEISSEFEADAQEPVEVIVDGSTYVLNGDKDSAIDLFFGIFIAESVGETHIDIVDFDNEKHQVTISQAKDMMMAQALNYRAKFHQRADLRIKVKHGKSKDEIDKVKYEKPHGNGNGNGNGQNNNASDQGNGNADTSGSDNGSNASDQNNLGGNPDKPGNQKPKEK